MMNILIASVARAGGIEVPLAPSAPAPRTPGLVRRAAAGLAGLVAGLGRAALEAQDRRPTSYRSLLAREGAGTRSDAVSGKISRLPQTKTAPAGPDTGVAPDTLKAA